MWSVVRADLASVNEFDPPPSSVGQKVHVIPRLGGRRDAPGADHRIVPPQARDEVRKDRFKEVNDTFGHQSGDVLLREIGPRLRRVLRESDVRVLDELRATGVRVSIDDFGTGYSSLAYLKRLPADELKIDRSFVQHMAIDAGDTAILRSVIALGHELGLLVTAEGVEDAASLDWLRTFGCDCAQGYFFARPLDADSLTDFLRDRSPSGAAAPRRGGSYSSVPAHLLVA